MLEALMTPVRGGPRDGSGGIAAARESRGRRDRTAGVPPSVCLRSRREAMRWLAAFPLAGLLPWPGPAGSAVAGGGTPGEVRIGGILRDAVLDGLNGPSRRLSQYRGRPLIINVWASWCGPCMEEMASLERLAWQDDPMPFAMIGISTDDYPERARAVLTRTNATLRHYIDHELQLENMLGASSIPLTVLVDSHGKVIDKIYGARQWDSPESIRLIGRAFGLRAPASSRS
jgi:thiol-disulfide isomerase/thioredoxin